MRRDAGWFFQRWSHTYTVISQKSLKFTKVPYLLRFFNKIRTSAYPQDFDILNYEILISAWAANAIALRRNKPNKP